MNRVEAVNWLINIMSDIGKAEHRDLWCYEQALSEIREMIEHECEKCVFRPFKQFQPESCEGCKHIGLWENEVEYGYSSPCTRCKRRVSDNYER